MLKGKSGLLAFIVLFSFACQNKKVEVKEEIKPIMKEAQSDTQVDGRAIAGFFEVPENLVLTISPNKNQIDVNGKSPIKRFEFTSANISITPTFTKYLSLNLGKAESKAFDDPTYTSHCKNVTASFGDVIKSNSKISFYIQGEDEADACPINEISQNEFSMTFKDVPGDYQKNDSGEMIPKFFKSVTVKVIVKE